MIIIIAALLIASLAQTQTSRNPTDVDDVECRFVYADQLATAKNTDRRARIEAYNNRTNTALCNTTCRIVGRGGNRRAINLPPISSPDYVQCGREQSIRLYCLSGACVAPPAGTILNTTLFE